MSRPALVAPDCFKGTFSAPARWPRRSPTGLRAAGREAVELPVADGGEGTMDALVAALGGELRTATAADPLGRPVEAAFALAPGRPDGRGRDGAGQRAGPRGRGRSATPGRRRHARHGRADRRRRAAGAERVMVTVGGSATTDGGAGALEALERGRRGRELEVLCDVRTPFEQAPRVFGAAEGRRPGDGRRGSSDAWPSWPARWPRDPRGVPMTGAAGGLSGGLWAALRRAARARRGLRARRRRLRRADARARLRGHRRGPARRPDAPGQDRGRGGHALPPGRRGLPRDRRAGTRSTTFDARILDLASVTEAGTPAELREAGRALVAG